MRLINAKTVKLDEFLDDKVPPYAILSHTWGKDSEELTFRNVEAGDIDKPGVGSIKFRGCCKQAEEDGLGYVWIDTCCIDTTNLVELSEAINSMFRWYRQASICYAYLSDVPSDGSPRKPGSKFQSSRWFERGWTLQELLAPANLRFYNSEWHRLGTKGDMCAIIEKITGIRRQFLLGIAELRNASVAQRLSWAAQRDTTRKEDLAYCLLGIFDVTMPMIYGEGGSQAFLRLQEQIMRTTRDDSILAWGLSLKGPSSSGSTQITPGRILAAAPSDFVNCGHIVLRKSFATPSNSLDISGGSLRVYLSLLTTSTGETIGLLKCGPEHDTQKVVGIPLIAATSNEPSDEYIRPQGRCSTLLPNASSDVLVKVIHIRNEHQSRMPIGENRRYWLYVEGAGEIDLELIDVEPQSRWHKERALIEMSTEPSGDAIHPTLVRFRHKEEESLDFVIVLEFKLQESGVLPRYHVMICSRDTRLEELAEKFIYITRAFGKQSASNGVLNLQVTLEPVTIHQMFIIRLAAILHPPEVTVDLTRELQQFNMKLEFVSMLEEERQNALEEEVLNQKAEEKSAILEWVKRDLQAVEDGLRRLEEKRRLLTEELLNGTLEMDQLKSSLKEIKGRQENVSKQRLQTQIHLDRHWDSKSDALEPEAKLYHTPLGWAAVNGDRGIVKHLLDTGADIDSKNKDGRTPLSGAAMKGHEAVVKLLLEKGADIDSKDKVDRTPLLWAAMNGHEAVVKLLLENGAEVDSKNKDGWTPLLWATENRHKAVVKLLLEKGANIDSKNKDGQTPLSRNPPTKKNPTAEKITLAKDRVPATERSIDDLEDLDPGADAGSPKKLAPVDELFQRMMEGKLVRRLGASEKSICARITSPLIIPRPVPARNSTSKIFAVLKSILH
jgi:hypothetical protein